MKNSLRLALSALISIAATGAVAGERVGDFALIDHQGAQHHMAWYDDQEAVVILPQGVGVTDAQALAALQDLQAQYAAQNVKFFLLNPGLQTDRDAVAADLDAEMPVLMDDAQIVSEALGLSNMDEAVVYSPKSFRLFIADLYRTNWRRRSIA